MSTYLYLDIFILFILCLIYEVVLECSANCQVPHIAANVGGEMRREIKRGRGGRKREIPIEIGCEKTMNDARMGNKNSVQYSICFGENSAQIS